ncbi:DUF3048 domain-containing protein [Candidatus Leptofilum sp.]|uniref:DUF3048 domain-containing protein n=1 Tax=Candidatus Leptofilum sp. TaxID=3241576 RepID=UPI003B5A3B5C
MKSNFRRIFGLLLCMMVGIFLEACGNETQRPLPTLVPSTTPISAIETDSSIIASTFTPLPTVEVEILPSATPFPTVTVVPTSTPLPGLLLSAPEDFGTDRNPLTGEIVAEPANLLRRPLAIKVSNNPPKYARPQNGLSQADLVFEHVTEVDITRFTAIFYSQTPPDIGPVRSARLIDKELPAMYDAALAMSGAHPIVSQRLHGSDIEDRILRSHEAGFYRMDEDKPWEHTLHADPSGLWQAIAAHDEDRPPQFTAWMTFSTLPPPDGEPAGRVTVAYDTYTLVEWVYNAADGRYYRWADGEATIDANNEQQISAANVILLTAVHEKDRSICLTHSEGVCSDWPLEIQIWGQGEAIILRDGKQYPVTWLRENRSDMFTFVNAAGEPVPLQIGNSWFQVLPHYYANPITIKPN